MSADNYGIIHPHGGGWGLSSGSASDDRPDDLSRPWFTADTLAEVEAHAEDSYFEYGVSYRGVTVLRLAPAEEQVVKDALADYAYDCRESVECGDFSGPENDHLNGLADMADTILERMG